MANSRINTFYLDPIFTEQFFKAVNEEEMGVATPFALPATPEDLKSFLNSSENAVQYKANFGKVVDDLAKWAYKNNINTSPCKKFKKMYVTYSGSDDQHNKTTFHIYHEGIATLAKIISLLDNEKIPLAYRITTIQNLLDGLEVCGPGSYTNIYNAYAELMLWLNSPAYWMRLRKSLAEEKILSLIREIPEENLDDLSMEGMEIHYVNAILNRHANTIGIKSIEDKNIECCDPDLLAELSDSFKSNIPNLLSFGTIIFAAVNDLELEHVEANLEKDLSSALKRLEDNIKRLGAESANRKAYSTHHLLEYSVKGVRISENAEKMLILSIYSRLMNKGYIDTGVEKTCEIADGKNIVFISELGLEFTYVQEQANITPFFTYYCSTLSEGNPAAMDGLAYYIRSNLLTNDNRSKLLFLTTRFMQTQTYTDLLDTNQYLDGNFKSLLQTSIQNIAVLSFNQLKRLLQTLPLDNRGYAIEAIDTLTLTHAISDFMELGDILNLLPNDQTLSLIKRIDPAKLPLLILDNSFLLTIFSRINNDDHKFHLLKSLFENGAKDKLANRCSKLADILLKFSPIYWERVINLIGKERILSERSLTSLPYAHKKLSEAQWRILLELLGKENIISHAPSFYLLLIVLKQTDANQWGLQLRSLSDNVMILLHNDLPNLAVELKKLSFDQREIFLKLFGEILLPQFIQFIITDLTENIKTFNTYPSRINAFKELYSEISNANNSTSNEIFHAWAEKNNELINSAISAPWLFTINVPQRFVSAILLAYKAAEETLDANLSAIDSTQPTTFGIHQ